LAHGVSSNVPGPAIRAALFDWDCTLLDSRSALIGAWHESTEAVIGRRFPATAADELEVFTLPGPQIWPKLAEGAAQQEELIARFQQAYERTGQLVRAFPGVPEALQSLRVAGVALAVVTSKARRRFSLDAGRAGLEDLIDVAVCAEDAPAAKPDPSPLLKALELLEVPGSNAVMVGDTRVDVVAGLRAGTAVAGVVWGASTEDELFAAGAQAVLMEPEELVPFVLRDYATMKGA
jgi:HAD superfamily hydrolase (TIGR01509 family)